MKQIEVVEGAEDSIVDAASWVVIAPRPENDNCFVTKTRYWSVSIRILFQPKRPTGESDEKGRKDDKEEGE